MKLSDVSKNIYMRGPSQLSAPLCSQHTFCIYATANGLGGGVQTAFVPGRGKPWYATVSVGKLPLLYWWMECFRLLENLIFLAFNEKVRLTLTLMCFRFSLIGVIKFFIFS